MREMRDSGVELIGEIPIEWRVTTIKHLIINIKDGTHGTFQRVDDGKLLLSAKNVFNNGIRITDNESIISNDDYLSIISNGFPQKDDILLCCVGTIGRCCIYDFEYPMAFQRSVAFLRVNNLVTNKYLMYYLMSPNAIVQMDQLANSSAQSGLYMGAIKEIYVSLPPIPEQQYLTIYLDKKCKKIDSSIEKQKQIIEKLKEYKQSIIIEAVTKGLDKTVEMKDSGIEWIGKIPSHWKVVKNKNIYKFKSIKNRPNEKVLSLYRDYGVIIKSSRDDNFNRTSENRDSYKFVEKNDLVINKMKAWQGSIGTSLHQGIISPAYHVCELTSKKIYPWFIHYLLRSHIYLPEYRRLSGGIRPGQWDLSFDNFKMIDIVVPSYTEQQQIVAHLDEKCIQIEKTIEDKQKIINKLVEYKKSLIYEVVTGKVEV